MAQMISIGLGLLVVLLFVSVWFYVRHKVNRLTDREFHAWFQTSFLGMPGTKIEELPDPESNRRRAASGRQKGNTRETAVTEGKPGNRVANSRRAVDAE